MERGSLSRGGEVSLGRSKSLMAILKEQNHSCRWLRSLYLAAENEGNRTSEPQGDSQACLGCEERHGENRRGLRVSAERASQRLRTCVDTHEGQISLSFKGLLMSLTVIGNCGIILTSNITSSIVSIAI